MGNFQSTAICVSPDKLCSNPLLSNCVTHSLHKQISVVLLIFEKLTRKPGLSVLLFKPSILQIHSFLKVLMNLKMSPPASPDKIFCSMMKIVQKASVDGFIFQVEIRGGPDIFIHDGSPALLECVVTDFILPPQTVAWRHNSDFVAGTVDHNIILLDFS